MKRPYYGLCAVIFFGIFLTGTSHAATIRINLPKIELELEPGEVYSGEIVAENPTEDELRARIYLEDWVYAKGGKGDKVFSPASSVPRSASRWITYAPAEAIVNPFGRVVARYTIAVPKDAVGGYNAVLFFETVLGTVKEREGVSVTVAGRIGSLFMIEVKGTAKREGAVQSIRITSPEGNRPLEVETAFKNTGNVDVSLGGNFLIIDREGRVQGRGDLVKLHLPPGAAEKRTTEWVGRLPKGEYQMLLTYDLGRGRNLVEEKTFSVE